MMTMMLSANRRLRGEPQAGFTLIELVVALSLAGLVVLLIHQVLGASLDVSAHTRDALTAVRRQAEIRDRLGAWLREAGVSMSAETYAAFRAADQRAAALPADSLSFSTMSGAPVLTGPAEIELFIDHAPGTSAGGLVALVRSLDPTAEARTVELVPEATGLEARFLFRIGEEARWFRGWDSASSLPLAVELRILGEDVPALLRVPLTIPLGWSG